MHQVSLLSAFLCDSCIARKSQQVFKLKDNKLYPFVDSSNTYV